MSDMKCPVCGEKIEHIKDGWCNCKNRCIGSGSIELWLQFLRTREQLEITNAELDYIKEQIEKNGAFDNTRKALDVAIERLEQIAHESFQGDQQSINMGFHIRAAAALTDIEQITALTKGDNNE